MATTDNPSAMTAGVYGPNTAAVEAFLALLPSVTSAEWEQVDTAWNFESGSDRGDAWVAACYATSNTDRGDALGDALVAAWGATWHAAWDASLALVTRDLISDEQYTILVAPFVGIERFAAVLTFDAGDAA